MNTAILGSSQHVQPSLSPMYPDPRVVDQLDGGFSTHRGSKLQTHLFSFYETITPLPLPQAKKQNSLHIIHTQIIAKLIEVSGRQCGVTGKRGVPDLGQLHGVSEILEMGRAL